MQIKREVPPNYDDILKVLPPNERAVFAYGDTIYAPHIPADIELPPDLLVHEETHQQQQGGDPALWWQYYLGDPIFRLKQEIEAYGNQWRYVEGLNIKREGKDRFLEMIATDLSSALYGNLLTFGEAHSKIRNASKTVLA